MADLTAPLSDEERETLHEAVDIAENCDCCGSDYGWIHVYANVERIIAARLTEQREGIAEAIESQVAPRYAAGFITTRYAARIARDFGEA